MNCPKGNDLHLFLIFETSRTDSVRIAEHLKICSLCRQKCGSTEKFLTSVISQVLDRNPLCPGIDEIKKYVSGEITSKNLQDKIKSHLDDCLDCRIMGIAFEIIKEEPWRISPEEKTKRLRRLKGNSLLVFSSERSKELIEIARIRSPIETARIVRSKFDDGKLTNSARFLAILRRDYGSEVFEEFVKENVK